MFNSIASLTSGKLVVNVYGELGFWRLADEGKDKVYSYAN